MIRILWLCSLLLLPVYGLADDGEARERFIVHLETGPAWDPALPPGEQDRFAEHSANMKRLRDEGAIVFGARYSDYGLLIIESDSVDAVRAELEADPGVAAGIFVFRVDPISVFYSWRPPAAPE